MKAIHARICRASNSLKSRQCHEERKKRKWFEEYLDGLIKGKELGKVRIVLE